MGFWGPDFFRAGIFQIWIKIEDGIFTGRDFEGRDIVIHPEKSLVYFVALWLRNDRYCLQPGRSVLTNRIRLPSLPFVKCNGCRPMPGIIRESKILSQGFINFISGFWSGFLIFQNLFLVWFWFKVCIIFWCGLGSEQNKCHTCLVTRRLWFRVPFWPSINLKAFSLRILIP